LLATTRTTDDPKLEGCRAGQPGGVRRQARGDHLIEGYASWPGERQLVTFDSNE
jgi:hypothetical protein